MLLGSAVPGSSLVSFYFLWAILCPQAVYAPVIRFELGVRPVPLVRLGELHAGAAAAAHVEGVVHGGRHGEAETVRTRVRALASHAGSRTGSSFRLLLRSRTDFDRSSSESREETH